MRYATATAAAAMILASFASPDAAAATASKLQFQNASGFCQPALPVFDGQIRKRPTAVANEGTTNAFVSCSMQTSPEDANHSISVVALVLYNRGTTDREVTCNLVHGFQAGSTLFPLTLTVPAGWRQFFEWTAGDVGVAEIDFANFNCNLPVGVDIGYGYYYQTYEIGS